MAATDILPAVIVCDAGPIIHLHELASIDLLADFTKVLVPEAVWNEVQRHSPEALSAEVAFEKTPDAQILAREIEEIGRVLTLHRGELEALHLAQLQVDSILLTDDSAARVAAQLLSIRVHGTIGVLLRAFRRGKRTKEQTLARLHDIPIRSTLHLHQKLLEDVIADVRRA